ncbi:glycosyltransferase family 32 protein [Aquirufa sp. ROCK2-A2]
METVKQESIPKIIHYCWLGGKPLSPLGKKCLASWKKYLPDYQIIRWDESNLDVNGIPFTAQAYQVKKYAFVSDYLRCKVLYEHGGIYMDTDVEVLRNLDTFLDKEAFSCFEDYNFVNPGSILGSVKGNIHLIDLMHMYENLQFINTDATLNLKTAPQYLTELLIQRGLEIKDEYQEINGFTIYPREYFCPKSWVTKELNITLNTYTIHHFEGSWVSKFQKFKNAIKMFFGLN